MEKIRTGSLAGNALAVDASAKTRTHVAPEFVSGLKILMLSTTELESFAEDTAENNPLLEVNFSSDVFGFDSLPFEAELEPDAIGASDEFEFIRVGRFEDGGRFGSSSPIDWDFSRIKDDYIETETLQSFLRIQALGLNLSKEDAPVMDLLIESISEDGYFSGSVEQVAFESRVSVERVSRLLEMLKDMQPAGVAQSTLQECLAAQVSDADPHADMIVDIIMNRLSDVADGRMLPLARRYGVPIEAIRHAISVIRSLNPRPGAGFFYRPEYRYIMPDVIISSDANGLKISIPGMETPCLTLNGGYAGLLDSGDLSQESREYIKARRDEAYAVLRSLDARNALLQRFALYLVKRQTSYFLTEGRSLAPMTMQEVAGALDVHVSTVSRMVQGKYLKVDWGCIPMKRLFTRAIPRSEGSSWKGTISSDEVKRMITALVASEPPGRPYSDAALCALLNDRGVEIKRRTVAKYRDACGIPTQVARKWATEAKEGM